MKCPICQKETIDKSYMYYGLGDWDCDYPNTLHEEYICPNCKIKYVNGEYFGIEHFGGRATEKQIKCVKFINNMLDLNYEPIAKYPTSKFISKYIDKASKVYSLQQEEDYDEFDYCDWYNEFFNG